MSSTYGQQSFEPFYYSPHRDFPKIILRRLLDLQLRRFDPLTMAADADRRRIIRAHNLDVAALGNAVFHVEAPVGGIDEEAADAFALEVAAVAHGGGEHAGLLAGRAGPALDPGDRHQGFFRVRLILRLHALEHLAHDDRPAVAGQIVQAIDIRRPPDILHA